MELVEWQSWIDEFGEVHAEVVNIDGSTVPLIDWKLNKEADGSIYLGAKMELGIGFVNLNSGMLRKSFGECRLDARE